MHVHPQVDKPGLPQVDEARPQVDEGRPQVDKKRGVDFPGQGGAFQGTLLPRDL